MKVFRTARWQSGSRAVKKIARMPAGIFSATVLFAARRRPEAIRFSLMSQRERNSVSAKQNAERVE
jgi:hypothetical protein